MHSSDGVHACQACWRPQSQSERSFLPAGVESMSHAPLKWEGSENPKASVLRCAWMRWDAVPRRAVLAVCAEAAQGWCHCARGSGQPPYVAWDGMPWAPLPAASPAARPLSCVVQLEENPDAKACLTPMGGCTVRSEAAVGGVSIGSSCAVSPVALTKCAAQAALPSHMAASTWLACPPGPSSPAGETSDNVAAQFNVPREVQDAAAVASHAKALKAQVRGAGWLCCGAMCVCVLKCLRRWLAERVWTHGQPSRLAGSAYLGC